MRNFVLDNRHETVDGSIVQHNTLDQHSSAFHPLIKELEAPPSSCGAFSCANALLIAAHVAAGEPLETVGAKLTDYDTVEPEVRRAMACIRDSRRAYVEANAHAFETKSEVRQYMTAWAANYEISDYLTQEGIEGRAQNVFFLRYNQWPERNTATHEEAARLVEEQRFGGIVTGDKADVELEQGASRFIVERFAPERVLQTPEQWLAEENGACLGGIFVLDLNGHFATAVATGTVEEPKLVVVNTTGGNYVDNNVVPAFAFELTYPAHSVHSP